MGSDQQLLYDEPFSAHMKQVEGLTAALLHPQPSAGTSTSLVTQAWGPWRVPWVPLPTTSAIRISACLQKRAAPLGFTATRVPEEGLYHCTALLPTPEAGKGRKKEIQHTSGWMELQGAICGRLSFLSQLQAILLVTLLIRQKLLTGEGRRVKTNLPVNASTNWNYGQTSVISQ